MAKLRNQAGRLTAYGLACGYVEQFEYNDQRITLWHEGGIVYHVRHHDFKKGERVFWNAYEKLSKARECYDQAVDELARKKMAKAQALILCQLKAAKQF